MKKTLFRTIVMLAVVLATVSGSLANTDLEFRWMEVLVRRVEPTFRELEIFDYRSGLSPSAFHVAGSVNLGELKAGEHVLALVGVDSKLILEIRKVAPPVGDKRYQEALRRLEAEGEDRAL